MESVTVGTTATREEMSSDKRARRQAVGFWLRYIGRTNPARMIQEIMPSQRASAGNDFVPTLLQDAALYDLLDEMVDKDLVIGGTEATLAAQILAREQRFEVDDEDDARAIEVRDFVERACHDVGGIYAWTDVLKVLLLGARRHGFSVCEILWRVEGGRFVPDAIVHRHPGQFEFDETGRLYLYDGTVAATREPVAFGKFIVHRNLSLYGNPFGQSDIFPIRWYWFLKKLALKAWCDGVETYGLPILTGRVDADSFNGANGPSLLAQRTRELEDAMAMIRSNSAIILPPGVTLESIARGLTNGTVPHATLIDYLDRSIVRYLSGSTLSTMENAGTGSLAQSKTHGQIAAERLVSLCRALAETVQRDLVEPLVRLNFGEDAPMPRFVIDVDDEEDVVQALSIFQKAIDLGIQVSRRQFREWFGLDAPEDDEDAVGERTRNEIFQYHLAGGVVTVNEIRERLNLEPVPWGEERATLGNMGASADAPSPDFTEIFSVNDLRRSEGLPAVSWGNVPAKSAKSIYANKGTAKSRTPAAAKAKPKPAPPVAKFDDRGREFELTFVSILEGIARAIKQANEAAIIEAIREGLQRIRENYGNDAIMTVGAAQVARMTAPLLDGDLAEAYAAIRIQAALATMRIASRAVPGIGVGVSLDDVAPAYRAGIEWMLSRDIMTKTDVEDMVRAVSLISDGLNAAAAERSIREHVFALANARTEELTAQMTRLITGAVERGDTVGSFLQAMDEVIERGELPAMTDAYLETVFRTETANIYQRQRLASMNDPMVAGEIWGVELFAIDDERSRPTHAATDGLMLKKGSAAFNAWLPGPPYSYNCRCTSAPVMMADGASETFGAEDIVAAIERFAEGDGCGCGTTHESFNETGTPTTPRPRGGIMQAIRRAFRL